MSRAKAYGSRAKEQLSQGHHQCASSGRAHRVRQAGSGAARPSRAMPHPASSASKAVAPAQSQSPPWSPRAPGFRQRSPGRISTIQGFETIYVSQMKRLCGARGCGENGALAANFGPKMHFGASATLLKLQYIAHFIEHPHSSVGVVI